MKSAETVSDRVLSGETDFSAVGALLLAVGMRRTSRRSVARNHTFSRAMTSGDPSGNPNYGMPSNMKFHQGYDVDAFSQVNNSSKQGIQRFLC
jgi:hypothetical protein